MPDTKLSQKILEKAQNVIDQLRANNISDITAIEFYAGTYLSGGKDKELCQAVIYKCSGFLQPLSKCTLAMTGEYLKGELMKTQLF